MSFLKRILHWIEKNWWWVVSGVTGIFVWLFTQSLNNNEESNMNKIKEKHEEIKNKYKDAVQKEKIERVKQKTKIEDKKKTLEQIKSIEDPDKKSEELNKFLNKNL